MLLNEISNEKFCIFHNYLNTLKRTCENFDFKCSSKSSNFQGIIFLENRKIKKVPKIVANIYNNYLSCINDYETRKKYMENLSIILKYFNEDLKKNKDYLSTETKIFYEQTCISIRHLEEKYSSPFRLLKDNIDDIMIKIEESIKTKQIDNPEMENLIINLIRKAHQLHSPSKFTADYCPAPIILTIEDIINFGQNYNSALTFIFVIDTNARFGVNAPYQFAR